MPETSREDDLALRLLKTIRDIAKAWPPSDDALLTGALAAIGTAADEAVTAYWRQQNGLPVPDLRPEALEFAHACRWPDSRVDLARLCDEYSRRMASGVASPVARTSSESRC